MPAFRYTKEYRSRKRGYVWLAGPLLDQILEWLTNIRLVNGGNVQYGPHGINLSIPVNVGGGSTVVVVKIVGGKDMAGYYEADLYGNGSAETATQASVSVALREFDITYTDPQGFYLATPVSGEADTYEVVGQVPAPPAAGNYYLRSSAGLLSWIEAGGCNAASSGSV